MTNKTPQDAARVVEEERIPLVEERVTFDRQVREGRTVRVQTRPVHETVTISEPVSRDEVSVERVPVGKVVDEIPPTREEGDVTIIPVVQERARVIIERVLTEEIHLRRTRSTKTTETDVELRRTEVEIDENAGPAAGR